MYSYFSDLHVDLLAQALLEPGEQRIGQTVGRYVPWWALGWVNETYLVIATDRRVILIEHRMAWFHQAVRLHSVQSLPWQQVQETRLSGIFGKKLTVKGQGQNGPVTKKLRIPNPLFGLLAPMRNNVGGARAVAAGFQTTRVFGAAPAVATLPSTPYAAAPQLLPPPVVQAQAYPQQQYAQLPYSQQPQPPQAYSQAPETQQGYAQPAAYPLAPDTQRQPIPAFNAPGYASVPPAASAAPAAPRQGIAPTPPRPSARPPQG
jgi:hypothetical protein